MWLRDVSLEEATKLALILGATHYSYYGAYYFYSDKITTKRTRYCILTYYYDDYKKVGNIRVRHEPSIIAHTEVVIPIQELLATL